jgi:hypothetical protein
MPPLQSEGCIVISDPEDKGPWLSFRCIRPDPWIPSAAEIAAMEAKMEKSRLPLGSLDRYARYYAAFAKNGVIFGKLVPAGGNDLPGVHLIEQSKLPVLATEGCVTVFVADSARVTSFNCARPGAWTPSDAQVAELEDLLQHHGGPKLEQHDRHYSGVTKDGRKIIQGDFLADDPRHRIEPRGIHIHSEVESPHMADGGCGFVMITYNPSTKVITWQCNGPHFPNLIDQGAYDPSSGKTTYKCWVAKVRAERPWYWRGPSGYVAVPPLHEPPSDCCNLPSSFRAPNSGITEIVSSHPMPSEETPAHPFSICPAR